MKFTTRDLSVHHACQHRTYVQYHNSCIQMHMSSLKFRFFSKHKVVCLSPNCPIHILPRVYNRSMTNFLQLYTNKEANCKGCGRKNGFFDTERSWHAWYEASESAIQTTVGEPEQSGFGELIRNGKYWIILIYLSFSECKLQHHLLEAHIGPHVTKHSLNKLSSSALMIPVNCMS